MTERRRCVVCDDILLDDPRIAEWVAVAIIMTGMVTAGVGPVLSNYRCPRCGEWPTSPMHSIGGRGLNPDPETCEKCKSRLK